MNLRSQRAGAIFFGASLVLLFAVIFIVFQDIRSRRRSETLSQTLVSVDSSLESGRPQEAVALLEQGAGAAQTQQGWLSVLKRGVEFARHTGDWGPAMRLAHRGAETLPGNETLWAIAAYTTMRAGKDAAWIAREHLSGDRFNGIRAEALLRSELVGPDGEQSAAGDRRQSRPDATSSAGSLAGLTEESEPEEFLQAFELTADRRFLLDAALQFATAGNLQRALEIALRAEAFEVAAYLAYDIGQPDRARALLERMDAESATSTELSLLRADIARRMGEIDEAARIYREIINSDPAASPIPYHNLVWYASILGRELPTGLQTPTALAVDGANRFPSDTSLARVATISLLGESRERSEEFSESRVEQVERPGTLELLRYHLFRREQPYDARLAGLWRLWNRYGELQIARYLAWLSVSIGNTEELRLIVRSAGSDNIPHYAGFLAIRDGRLAVAREFFHEAHQREEGWEATANTAALLSALQRHDDAAEVLQPVIERYDEEATNPIAAAERERALPVLLYQRALALAGMGRSEEAFSTVERALSLSPSFSEARMLRRRLADQIDR